MGGLGHSKVFSTWGIPSSSYIKSSRLHTTASKHYSWRDNHLIDVYHKAIEWVLHHMNGMVLFRKYTLNLDTLGLSVPITFLFFITIGEVCMLKSEMSLLGVNNVIE